MYKSSFVNGDKWFEWLKLGPGDYLTYRINGNGSHTNFDHYKLKSLAKKWVQFMNDNYATHGGRKKVSEMSDGIEFLSKATYARFRLEYLRGEIERACISYEEIAELQGLRRFVNENDMLLRGWAGVPE